MTDKKDDQIIRVLFLLDSSGSMSATKQAAIDGFNKFLEEQKSVEGLAELTLTTFSSGSSKLYDRVDIKTAPELTVFTYRPGGQTALLDAIGDTIVDNITSNQKTILAILTDGEENASRRYDKARIAELIENVQTNLEWQVIFLGANIANFRDFTRGLNMRDEHSMTYTSDNAGIAKSLGGNISASVTNFRNMHNHAYAENK